MGKTITKEGLIRVWEHVLLTKKYRELINAMSLKEVLLSGVSPELQESKLWIREDGLMGINEKAFPLNKEELEKARLLFDQRKNAEGKTEVSPITQAAFDILSNNAGCL